MKSTADLVKGFINKAQSDLENAAMCLHASRALDTACFHAQQAAEKFVKAYLTAHAIDYPPIHHVEKLVEICATHDPAFFEIKLLGQELSPYAVQVRYDFDFWPSADTAREAHAIATKIKEYILTRIPSPMKRMASASARSRRGV